MYTQLCKMRTPCLRAHQGTQVIQVMFEQSTTLWRMLARGAAL